MKVLWSIAALAALSGQQLVAEESTNKVVAIQQASIEQILQKMESMQEKIDTLQQENKDLLAKINSNTTSISSNSTTISQQGNTLTSHGKTLTSHGTSITSNSQTISGKADKSVSGNNCISGGTYSLCMQSDGNVVVYQSGRAKWASRDTIRNNPGGNVIIGAGSCNWALQADGNFVRYNCDGGTRSLGW